MGSIRETEAWKVGDQGQRFIAEWLCARGFWVVPSYDYSGPTGDKAPRMFGPGRSLILPDLDVSRDGRRYWVEVKTKTEATFFRKLGRWEHGFDRRHFEQYLQIESITGCRVFVVFYEIASGRVLGQWLAKLARVKRENDMGRTRMAYFPVSEMELMDAGAFMDADRT